MGDPHSARRERLLDPADRICEILFGLIMAVTIVGALAIAGAGREDVRSVTAAAIGCNLAWGLVDAVMYVVRTVAERARNHALARGVAAVDAERGRGLIAHALPDSVAAVAGTSELEGMRLRLLALRADDRPVLGPRDLLEAVGIFLVVVLATFPVVVPFLLTDNVAAAMRAAQVITLVMLFLAGFAFGRYASYAKPLRIGLAMAAFGAVLITVVKALGG